MKKEWIIFSIIWSFLSLIFSFLLYFGIIRYLNLYIYNPKSYLKKYFELEKACNKKVVINLSITNPDKLKPVINSLLDQTVRVDEISINTDKKLPAYIKDLNKVVRTYQTDLSIKPCIMRENHNDTIIIFINDDKIYGKDFIQDAMDEYQNRSKVEDSDSSSIIKISDNGEIITNTNIFNTDLLDKCTELDFNIKEYVKDNKSKYIKYSENYKKI
jgi:hypothetical protein